jgi:hypothetical protein
MRQAGHTACRGGGVHRVLKGKLERNRPLGRPGRRWKDNIKMGWGKGGMDCIAMVQDRDRLRTSVDAVINLVVP